MQRCVIFGAAPVENYGRIEKYLRPDDYIIACDGGLSHLEKLGLKADLITGDFDSHEKPAEGNIIVLPREKDDTDTFYAAKEALKRGFTDFLLTGMTGARIDHTLANLSLLMYLAEHGAKALILDDWSEISVISDGTFYVEDSFSYFSLITPHEKTENVTIRNAKFLLTDGTIKDTYQYAVSNEVLPGKTAEISLKNGKLILIKVF